MTIFPTFGANVSAYHSTGSADALRSLLESGERGMGSASGGCLTVRNKGYLLCLWEVERLTEPVGSPIVSSIDERCPTNRP